MRLKINNFLSKFIDPLNSTHAPLDESLLVIKWNIYIYIYTICDLYWILYFWRSFLLSGDWRIDFFGVYGGLCYEGIGRPRGQKWWEKCQCTMCKIGNPRLLVYAVRKGVGDLYVGDEESMGIRLMLKGQVGQVMWCVGPGRVQGLGIFIVKGELPEHAHLWASGQSGGLSLGHQNQGHILMY